ncbi:MAG: hypothetical protein AAF282_16835 [Cyanobacteria bacterium P01_A01_bin.15]
MAKAILNTVLGTLVTSAAVIGTTAQTVAAQGFTGSFAPEQWELFNSAPALPGVDNSQITIGGVPLAPFNGSVDFTDAPGSLTLLGSDLSAILDGFGLDCNSEDLPINLLFLCDSSFTTVFATVPEASVLSFNWSYSTADGLGAAFDPFGFAVGTFPPDAPLTDGLFTELTDRDGASEQSGTASVQVEANQIFGFQIGTADNQGGRATATISQFQVEIIDPGDPVAVPEPTSGIAIAALAGLGLRLSKRSCNRKK